MSFPDLIVSGAFDHVDAGTGTGESLEHASRIFGGRRGLGLELQDDRVAEARSRGLEVVQVDLLTTELPESAVTYATVMDVLEHLPDADAAEYVLRQLVRLATDFVFIRHPSFEDMGFLARNGLKVDWTDWQDHPNDLRLRDYEAIFTRNSWTQYAVFARKPIVDSLDPRVVPLSAGQNLHGYDPGRDGSKPVVRFPRILFGQYDILIRLTDDDGRWNEVLSLAAKGAVARIFPGDWRSRGVEGLAEDHAMLSGGTPPCTAGARWLTVREASPPTSGRAVMEVSRDLAWELVSRCGIGPASTVAHIGGGSGGLLVALRERLGGVADFHLVDSEERMAWGRQHLRPGRVKFHPIERSATPGALLDESVGVLDVVVVQLPEIDSMNVVLEVVRALTRLLAPSGHMLLDLSIPWAPEVPLPGLVLIHLDAGAGIEGGTRLAFLRGYRETC